MYTRSSNAYELDWDYTPMPQERKTTDKKKTVKRKPAKRKAKLNIKVLNILPVPVKAALAAFFVLSVICYRCVYIYGLHSASDKAALQLETLTMENEQMTIAINSQIDSAKISEYAQKHLGLQKIDDRQVIYLTGDTKDTMGKIAKTDEKSKHKGLFGILAGVTEYLR